jgi:hypothetical protein
MNSQELMKEYLKARIKELYGEHLTKKEIDITLKRILNRASLPSYINYLDDFVEEESQYVKFNKSIIANEL